jgi:hypothetical protein
MEESFNLHATIVAVQQAMFAVVCHILFDAAVHGLVMAMAVGVAGFVLNARKNRFGKPLMNVCRRVSLICSILAFPGVLAILFLGHLPPAGVYNANSIGFVIFWSLICLHLSAEEMNYCFFIKQDPAPEQLVD